MVKEIDKNIEQFEKKVQSYNQITRAWPFGTWLFGKIVFWSFLSSLTKVLKTSQLQEIKSHTIANLIWTSICMTLRKSCYFLPPKEGKNVAKT